MFTYEEYWADWRLVVWQSINKSDGWAYQIEAWSVDRYMVATGRSGFSQAKHAIVTGRGQLFALLKSSFDRETKR